MQAAAQVFLHAVKLMHVLHELNHAAHIMCTCVNYSHHASAASSVVTYSAIGSACARHTTNGQLSLSFSH